MRSNQAASNCVNRAAKELFVSSAVCLVSGAYASAPSLVGPAQPIAGGEAAVALRREVGDHVKDILGASYVW
jgi:hypothetical protein